MFQLKCPTCCRLCCADNCKCKCHEFYYKHEDDLKNWWKKE